MKHNTTINLWFLALALLTFDGILSFLISAWFLIPYLITVHFLFRAGEKDMWH